jgi:hypothetical protein
MVFGKQKKLSRKFVLIGTDKISFPVDVVSPVKDVELFFHFILPDYLPGNNQKHFKHHNMLYYLREKPKHIKKKNQSTRTEKQK